MYWSHFGFRRQPFRPAVDPDSYFPAPSHEEAITILTGSFDRRDSMVLVDGKLGVGKSLAARKWLERLPPEVPRVVVPNTHAERPAALLQAILFDLGKPYHGLTEQELRLGVTDSLLSLAAESGYPTVLMLDEAQHLSQAALEELRLLGNLETRQGSILFTVMIAQPTLRDALRRPAYELVSQRVAAQAAIEPLTASESADYIRHQVRAAGGEPGKLLEENLIALLAGACEGVPRILNRAAALALELAANAEVETVDVEAGLEALTRLGLSPAESEEESESSDELSAVLLPHPSRTSEPSSSGGRKLADGSSKDEDAAARGPKDRASRKRTV